MDPIFQKTVIDGRYWFPDVHEALGLRLAHIAAGGYAETERQLPVKLREAVRIPPPGGVSLQPSSKRVT